MDQQDSGGDVQQRERGFQQRNRRPPHPEKRRGNPRLDAEHVVLIVKEEWKGAEFTDVLGHQADDGLVGVELDVSAEHEQRAAKEDEERGEGREELQLAPAAVERCPHARAQYTGFSNRVFVESSPASVRALGRIPAVIQWPLPGTRALPLS